MARKTIYAALLAGLGSAFLFLTTLSVVDVLGEYASRAYTDAAYHAHFMGIGKEAATLVFALTIVAATYAAAEKQRWLSIPVGLAVFVFLTSVSNTADYANVGWLVWIFHLIPSAAIGGAIHLLQGHSPTETPLPPLTPSTARQP